MQDIICAVCGKKQQARLLYKATFTKKNISVKTFSARRTPDKIHYQLNKCIRCGMIFSSPIFSNKEIFDLYKKSYLSYPDQVRYVSKTYVDLFHEIKHYLPKNPIVLDIGCGDGFFLHALQKLNITHLYGVEPGKPMVEQAIPSLRKKIKQSIFKKGLFPNNTFDLVCCFHTLDHIIDPNTVIKQAYAILKPHGLTLFVVHDTEAVSVKIFGEKSPIFDIEHIYLFNKKNISMLFEKHGFNVLTVADVKNTYPISYWVQMAGIPHPVKVILQYLLDLCKLSSIPFSFKGGNMYIVAQKK